MKTTITQLRLIAFISSIIPFGTFFIDKKLKNKVINFMNTTKTNVLF